MNSFKLFNRTSKNDIVSNSLNGIEKKDKDHSKSSYKILQPTNDKKKNIINTSTPPRFIVTKTTTSTNKDNKNGKSSQSELNEGDDDNENALETDLSKMEKENLQPNSPLKENSDFTLKKEKKLSKKEKRKYKKIKKSKNGGKGDSKSLASPTSSKPSTKSNFVDSFLHHSSSVSRKDNATGKYIGKQPVNKNLEITKDPVESGKLIKCYDETTQFQQHHAHNIKEKQSRMGYTSSETTDSIFEKDHYEIVLSRPQRRESRITDDQSHETPGIANEEATREGIQVMDPSTASLAPPKIPKENYFKFNFDNESMSNLGFPICLGMTTPSSPAFSCITPINGAESYNNSLNGDLAHAYYPSDHLTPSEEDALSSTHGYTLEAMFNKREEKGKDREEINEKDEMINEEENLIDLTEDHSYYPSQIKSLEPLDSEPSIEIREREVPMEFKTVDLIEDLDISQGHGHKRGKDKQKQKNSKSSKKKEKRMANSSLTINTKMNTHGLNSSSSLSSPSSKLNHHILSPNLGTSENKKKAWSSFRKLFSKKNGRKSYYRNSLSTTIDDSLRHANSSNTSGIIYDWDELRRRMELEENSTVCTESLSAREFAEAVGIPIISSSDEEDDLRLNNENDYSIGGAHTAPSFYGHTHRSTKSSGPILDMSIFIPPTEEEKKNNGTKRESMITHDPTNASIQTSDSFASSTTQDYLDRLGKDTKRKIYEDSQSLSTSRELNKMYRRSGLLRSKVYDNDSFTLSSFNNEPLLDHSPHVASLLEDPHYSHSVPYHLESSSAKAFAHDRNRLKAKPSWSSDDEKEKPMDCSTPTTPKPKPNILKSNDSEQKEKEKKDACPKKEYHAMTDSNFISKAEKSRKDPRNKSQASMSSFEVAEILNSKEAVKTDIKNRASCGNICQLEDDHHRALSRESLPLSNLGRRSPSFSSVRSYKTYSPVIKSYKGEDSMVQEFQKGRFTVTKPIYPSNNGHRVFIVTKDEENENGDSITTVSSVSSSPGKIALRKRSSSQPASFFSMDTSEVRSFTSSQKKVSSSLLKFGSSIPDTLSSEKDTHLPREVIKPKKSNSLIAGQSQSYSHNDFYIREHRRSATTSVTDFNRRKSTMSLDPALLNRPPAHHSFIQSDVEEEDSGSEKGPEEEEVSLISEDAIEKSKPTASLYSMDVNKSFNSLPTPPSPNPSLTSSPYPRLYKPKNSNSRFQVTYTPSHALSSSNRSIRSMKSTDSSIAKLNTPTMSKGPTPVGNKDTDTPRALGSSTKGFDSNISESLPEFSVVSNASSTRINPSFVMNTTAAVPGEEPLKRQSSNSSLSMSHVTAPTNMTNIGLLQQPLNNINQRTIGSISSVLTETGIPSNSSSPALNGIKISPLHGPVKPLSITTTALTTPDSPLASSPQKPPTPSGLSPLHSTLTSNHPNTSLNYNNNSDRRSSPIVITASTTSSNGEKNGPSLQEKSDTMDTSTNFIAFSPHKMHDVNNDYYNFFKYNDSYNSIFLSSSSRDNDKSEKETDYSSNNNSNNILDEMDKTEGGETFSEIDKTNDLSESSPPTPYYHHLTTPMEKPPVIPNSPISYKSLSSSLNHVIEENSPLIDKLPMKGNNNSNESFTIFDKELNITGDDSFHEGHSLIHQDSKHSSNSLTTPTLKSSFTNSNSNANSNANANSNGNNGNISSLTVKSSFGHYRSPSASSTNTNGSSRFTVIRESNEKYSPTHSSAKVSTKRLSNLHNITSISYDPSNTSHDSISNSTSTVMPSSKLKPSVVVESKSSGNGSSSGTVTTSTQSKNIGRFTVTRETIIS